MTPKIMTAYEFQMLLRVTFKLNNYYQDSEKVADFMTKQNKQLSNYSPIELFYMGKGYVVSEYVDRKISLN